MQPITHFLMSPVDWIWTMVIGSWIALGVPMGIVKVYRRLKYRLTNRRDVVSDMLTDIEVLKDSVAGLRRKRNFRGKNGKRF